MRRSGDIAIFSSRSPALAWLSVSGTSGSNPLSSSAESANRPSLGERRGGIRWRADAMVEIEAIAVIDD
jgi:hypothetical protein